ncbi:NADH-quinone oxidoreductase subunit C [Streptomyces lavendofoliae]|uniref:NADH-quinone oxidoreductase subunit C n=1 Tax=Streptomyces lavendofoliae TaxID=67314 RepID=UPI00300EF135
MNPYDRLPDAVAEIFGDGATAESAYDLLTVDVPAASWISALETARDELRCTYFDWLSAVDEPATGFSVCAHVVALEGGRVRRLLLRTTVPHDAPVLPSAVGVYAGAGWHERETYEMFGVTFTDHPHLVPLLLPEGFEGHPLRKDFVLAARVAKAWPGAKEPGESAAGAGHGGPKRRQMLPPGVPDPNDWGPLKGQLPPAPARPARGARAAGDRPVRRTRTAGEGSASQAPESAAPEATAPETPAPAAAAPRRARSASDGSASQSAAPAAPRRTRSASAGAGAGARTGHGAEPTASPTTPPRTRSADAPWNNPRPAFEDAPAPGPDAPAPDAPAPDPEAPAPDAPAATPPAPAAPAPEPPPAPEAGPTPTPDSGTGPAPDPEAAPEQQPTAPAPGPEAGPAPDQDAGPAPAPQATPAPGPEAGPAPDRDAGRPATDDDNDEGAGPGGTPPRTTRPTNTEGDA